MTERCLRIAQQYKSEIEEVVRIQKEENREAIFFIFEDGSTSDIIRGEPTHISLTEEEQTKILSSGKIVGSVHSHPTGFDPSTIDIMTAAATNQQHICVATPAHDIKVDDDFVLTCLDLSDLNFTQRKRLFTTMRRSSMGVTDVGQRLRKQFNIQRFDVDGCRTHTVKVEGLEFPAADRPSRFKFIIGSPVGIEGSIDGDEFLEE